MSLAGQLFRGDIWSPSQGGTRSMELHRVQSCCVHPAPPIRNCRTRTQGTSCPPGLSCTDPAPPWPLAFPCKTGEVNPRIGIYKLLAAKLVISPSAKPDKIPCHAKERVYLLECIPHKLQLFLCFVFKGENEAVCTGEMCTSQPHAGEEFLPSAG